ncbi:phospholipid scramblase-related protein [Schlesneria paludicola]|uniref:phospholipid scramblase-related protein n=1 Tax=Schlesneria paludicola TaxID=360056 RepID=UPI00058E5B47|nr:phospholipid scramblase-related protein [Schlesneria paludicola]
MLLDRQTFLVKERAELMRLTDRYDIFDPETGEPIGFAEEKISGFAKLLRLVISKQLIPTTIVVQEDEASEPVITIKRGLTLLRSKVDVIDKNQTPVGFFKSKLFSLGGGFTVHNAAGEQIANVQGNWKGWDFKLLDMSGQELGRVNKKWAGAIKEIFTSADNYMISLSDEVGSNPGLAALLLAAGLAIDIVFKEANT